MHPDTDDPELLRCQKTRDPTVELKTECGYLMNRAIIQWRERHCERRYIPYSKAYQNLSIAQRIALCPAEWTSAKTKQGKLVFFARNILAIYEELVNGDVLDDERLRAARDRVLEIVRNNQSDRKRLDLSEPDRLALESSAIQIANLHIVDSNRLFAASAKALRLDLPEVSIPLLEEMDAPVSKEQCKALPREKVVQLARYFWRDIPRTSLTLGAIIMLCCMTRTAETCPKFSEVADYGEYGVYKILSQSDGRTRIAQLKSKSSYRTIILPKYAMDAIRERKRVLLEQGYSEMQVEASFIVSADTDINHLATPGNLSAYIKNVMDHIGFGAAYWSEAEHLMSENPDKDLHGNNLQDVTAYVLRRNGCTYLMNCAAQPQFDGNKDSAAFGLVDALMGHKLRQEDRRWEEWIGCEDNWAKIAQMLETIVYDPDHSAHPAFGKHTETEIAQSACHSVQKIAVQGDGVTISVLRRSEDLLEVTLPSGCKLEKCGDVIRMGLRHLPIVQEELGREFYRKNIRIADEIYDKERREAYERTGSV